jgi:hypothetical protein
VSLRKSPTMTAARLEANGRNGRNARKSTGPRTTQGKSQSRLNSLREGNLTGQQDPLTYTNFSIEAPPATDANSAWSDTQLQWINSHVRQDGYDPVP